jgi:hypothetical protein
MTRIKYPSWQLILLTLAIGGIPGHTWAQTSVKVCYTTAPGQPQTCVIPNSDGSINTNTTGGGYPANSTPVSANANGSTGSFAATLNGAVGKTTYVCGVTYQATNATAAQNQQASLGTVAVAGNLLFTVPTLAAGATIPNPPPLNLNFFPCLSAGATNTSITFTAPALGAGAVSASVNIWGFQQ